MSCGAEGHKDHNDGSSKGPSTHLSCIQHAVVYLSYLLKSTTEWKFRN